MNDSRCLIQDDYGIRADLYGNLFLHTGQETPAVCCNNDGKSHFFSANIFAFEREPAAGWQASVFTRNWYGSLQTRPQLDKEAMDGVPFPIDGLEKRLEADPQEQRRIGDLLAEAAVRTEQV